MTDIIDRASQREQIDRDRAIDAARTSQPAAKATGRCLWCNTELEHGQRWCDYECREDWELAQEARKRYRGRG